MDLTTTYTALGRLLAVVERAAGLTPSAHTNCMQAPKSQLMGLHLSRAMPRIRRSPELQDLVAEIMEHIDLAALEAIPAAVPPASPGAGIMLLAYYHEISALKTLALARPPQAGADWSTVDWSKDNAELASAMGVSRQAVFAARKRHALKA